MGFMSFPLFSHNQDVVEYDKGYELLADVPGMKVGKFHFDLPVS